MVKISVHYQGELHCRAVHEPSESALATDAPVDNQGRGESFSPTDLCATALATCMTTIMGMRARDLGVDLTGMKIEIVKEMSQEGLRRIARLPVEFWIPCDPSEEQKALLRHAAETCPVMLSLDREIEKPITMHWGASV